jgi:hypothetical protein
MKYVPINEKLSPLNGLGDATKDIAVFDKTGSKVVGSYYSLPADNGGKWYNGSWYSNWSAALQSNPKFLITNFTCADFQNLASQGRLTITDTETQAAITAQCATNTVTPSANTNDYGSKQTQSMPAAGSTFSDANNMLQTVAIILGVGIIGFVIYKYSQKKGH